MQRHIKHLSTITRLPRMFLFIGIPSFTKFLIELKFSISIFSIQIFLLFFLHPQMLVLLIQSLNFTVFRCELSTTVVNVKCVSFTRWPFILFLSKSAGTRTEVANYSDHFHERKNQEIQKKKNNTKICPTSSHSFAPIAYDISIVLFECVLPSFIWLYKCNNNSLFSFVCF